MSTTSPLKSRGTTAPPRHTGPRAARGADARADWSRQRVGFTLIEVMVVLAILGIVIGLAMPFLAGRQPAASLSGASVELTAALRAAREAAIAEDRPVVFAGGADGYFIDGRWRRLAAASVAPAAARVDIASGAQISFYPSGGSSGGRIVLRDGAARREIAVDAVTGHAAIVR